MSDHNTSADPVALTRQLIRIDSVNSSLVVGAAGESEIAAFCAAWLTHRGFEITTLGAADRPSIVGTRRGTSGRSLMLNGHLDTVAATAAQRDPVEHDSRLYGRGAFDMKSGLAALMIAAADARTTGDVIVALVADEEFGSLGTEAVLEQFTADAAIVAEPSGLQLTVAHRGFAWFEIAIEGRAAHGSQPELGVDAIAHAVLIMRELDELGRDLRSGAGHPLLGHGTVRVSTIVGGVDAATVAPAATLTIERRFIPGQSPDDVERELRRALGPLLDSSAPGTARARLTRLVARGAFEAREGSPIVEVVARNTEAIAGSAVRRGEPFWTDAGLYAEAGIPCLVIGVDGGGAHADEEWASTKSIRQLTEILRRSIEDFCG
ncbi:MAG: M20/M25/M40 family metallo-hydrolase [Rhodoglobus sp.]